MSDLSKRLRQRCHMMDCLMARNQAADEIERLTARLKSKSGPCARDCCRKLQEKAADEIERLQSRNEELQDQVDCLQAKVHLCAAYDKLQSRIELLEAALEKIISDELYNEAQMAVIAQAALKEDSDE